MHLGSSTKKNVMQCDFFTFFAFNTGRKNAKTNFMSEKHHPFLDLIEHNSAAIDKICRSFCGGNREDHEDLRQDIIVNLWLGWERYCPKAKSVTWVWKVATNTAISWRRHKVRQLPVESLTAIDVVEDAEDKASVEMLNALIAKLPPGDQRLLRLYLDGWSQQEIGEMMGASETNVQTRIWRIKQKMKEMATKWQ